MRNFLLFLSLTLSINVYSQCASQLVVTAQNKVQLVWPNNNRPSGITFIKVYNGQITGQGVTLNGNNNTYNGVQGWLSTNTYGGANNTSNFVIIEGNDTCTFSGAQIIVLPVEFTYIKLERFGDSYTLLWETAWEKNNFGFVVQKKYENEGWIDIKFIGGQNNKYNPTQYQFSERLNKPGTYYFRLLQMDYDGAYNYSDIVTTKLITPFDVKQYIYFPAFEGVWMRKEKK